MPGAAAIRRLTGAAITAAIPALADLRIAVFRAYPYLYAGDTAYERAYLADYARDPQALIVLAEDGGRAVGASTAMPLASAHDYVRAPFAAQRFSIPEHFYFGESVLLDAYRGQGIGVQFFAEREAHARAFGFAHATFCAVVRPADHPARPADYVPLDAFWRNRGYAPAPGLTAAFSWTDIGDASETAKPMQFWRKRLS